MSFCRKKKYTFQYSFLILFLVPYWIIYFGIFYETRLFVHWRESDRTSNQIVFTATRWWFPVFQCNQISQIFATWTIIVKAFGNFTRLYFVFRKVWNLLCQSVSFWATFSVTYKWANIEQIILQSCHTVCS